MAATDSIRVPPDSTGKKILTVERTFIDYDAANTSQPLTAASTLTGNTSGATALITGFTSGGFAANEGRIFLDDVVGTFADNEPLKVAGIDVATAKFDDLVSNAPESMHIQAVVLTDPDFPSHKQAVDRFGASAMTFTDGSPILSPFGDLMTGSRYIIKDYRFAYNSRDELFGDVELSSATVGYDTNRGVVLLTNPTTTGAQAQRTSHFYHPYLPGIGTELLMTIQMGDAGKANVTRQWGLFDDNNGVFFEIVGTTLNAVIRSDATGSVVEDRVAQSAWSKDKLDGTDDISFTIDITKGNIYQIDYQWLGAGVVVFSVYDSAGQRIKGHVFEHANKELLPYMRTGTLPIRVNQENTGTAGSSSEMRFCCASVSHTSTPNLDGRQFIQLGTTQIANTTNNERSLLGIRPKLLHNSIENHALIHHRSIVVSSDPNATADTVIRVRTLSVDESNVTSVAFANVHTTESIAQIDTSGTTYGADTASFSGKEITILPAGGSITFSHGHEDGFLHTGETHNYANGSQQETYITAEVIGGGTANVTAVMNWEELIY